MSDKSIIIWGALILTLLVSVGLWGCPQYRVYSKTLQGKSVLAEAEFSRQVAIAEAKAKQESAMLLAAADTLRAHGIARSNEIIGASLTEEYIHWYWIDNLERNPNAVIYVPTEANMPIMEAGRFNNLRQE